MELIPVFFIFIAALYLSALYFFPRLRFFQNKIVKVNPKRLGYDPFFWLLTSILILFLNSFDLLRYMHIGYVYVALLIAYYLGKVTARFYINRD